MPPLKTKNAYRTLPVSEDIIRVLKQQKKKVGSSLWVFPFPLAGPSRQTASSTCSIGSLKRAGLPRSRFHDLRHTFATLALQNGVDIKTVSGCWNISGQVQPGHHAHVTTAAQKEAARTTERKVLDGGKI